MEIRRVKAWFAYPLLLGLVIQTSTYVHIVAQSPATKASQQARNRPAPVAAETYTDHGLSRQGHPDGTVAADPAHHGRHLANRLFRLPGRGPDCPGRPRSPVRGRSEPRGKHHLACDEGEQGP